jgi:hypothetical protein
MTIPVLLLPNTDPGIRNSFLFRAFVTDNVRRPDTEQLPLSTPENTAVKIPVPFAAPALTAG